MSELLQSGHEQLSDHELEELADFLGEGPESMNIEMMDGFLAAIVCSPELVMPGDFLHYIWGEEREFETAEQAQKYAGLILRHWNSIISQLDNNDVFIPFMLEHEEGYIGNDWASGFMFGIHLGGDDWHAYIEDDEISYALIPILLLANEQNPDSKLRPGPISSDERKEILTALAVGVPKIYDHLDQQRKSNASRIQQKQRGTIKRSARKIGRNEPCPCGSEKKFKKCCGMN